MKKTFVRVIVSILAVLMVALLVLQSTGLAAPIITGSAPVILPDAPKNEDKPDGDFIAFLEELDTRDVYSPAEAVQRLDKLYPEEGEIIPDELYDGTHQLHSIRAMAREWARIYGDN